MQTLTAVDMHTGGEPVRIVTGGYPELPKGTILEKRAYLREKLDHLRKILMFEPRGHADMYGALLVETDLPGADLAVLFMHNEGYSTMCGHAVIALGRYAVDHGLVPMREPATPVSIECPCGLVRAEVGIEGGRAGRVSFESVPSFLAASGVVALPAPFDGAGPIPWELAYGGAYYVIAEVAAMGLRPDARARDFGDAAAALVAALRDHPALAHPDHADLSYLYGAILTDGHDGSRGHASRNVCVFADGQIDRSPTGSGVTARLAALHARGRVGIGETRLFESIVGSRFEGRVAGTARAGGLDAVTVIVTGRAYYSGRAEFIVEADDSLGGGFRLR